MHRNYTNAAKHYQKQHRWNSIWKKVTMVLASVVVFATTYALILPAITMEPEYICGKEAHLHSEACYQLPEVSTVSSLVCTPNALGVHEHTTECCDENGVLKCGIADFVLHTHDIDCFDENGVLLCALPEIKTHVHDETCFQQPHVHLDTCYIQQRGELVCTLEEGSVHTHLDTCYTQQENLICTLSETDAHTHTIEACYAETKMLLCTEPEVEPHTHSDSCYTLETTKTCSLEETEGHLHTDACFQTSSVFTCTLTETAGHTHSDTCYSEPVYTLTCKEEETAGHTHSSTCRETVSVLTCALEENIPHVHTDSCFVCTSVLQCAQPTGEDIASVLNCEKKELFPHIHEATCFNESGTCICGLLQVTEHVHGDTCFVITQEQTAEPVLMCGYEEEHEHTEDCVAKKDADEILTGDALLAQGYYCGIAEHIHELENDCFDEYGGLKCTMTEHIHEPDCMVDPNVELEVVYYCGKEPHVHDNTCLDTTRTLLCVITENHVHAEGCYDETGALACAKIENHVHSDACYATGGLICGQEAHTHTDECTTAPVENTPSVEEETGYACGYITHSHTEICFGLNGELICEQPEHEHSEDCIANQNTSIEEEGIFYCGYLAHSHTQLCLDQFGELVCEQPEHEHSEECMVDPNASIEEGTFYCGYLAHSHTQLCLDQFGELVCEQPEHEHSEECTIDPNAWLNEDCTFYCGITPHSHDEFCYDLSGELICEQPEHEHIEACTQLPRNVQKVIDAIDALPDPEEAAEIMTTYEQTDDVGSLQNYIITVGAAGREAYEMYQDLPEDQKALVSNLDKLINLSWLWSIELAIENPGDGELYHHQTWRYYHVSRNMLHYIDGGTTGDSYVRLFMLVDPANANIDKSKLTPSADWTAASDSNYWVAYCADWRTPHSSIGAAYDKLVVDNARFSEADRLKLKTIISNSYPFISYEEMRTRLVKAGVINNDWICYTDEYDMRSEFITATGWAIWSQTTANCPTFSATAVVNNDGTAGGNPDDREHTFNPILNGGHTYESNASAHIEAIKDWLLSQTVPEKLAVTGYDIITKDTDSTLSDTQIKIVVQLNRAVKAGENVDYTLTCGGKTGDTSTVAVGKSSFEMIVDTSQNVDIAYLGTRVDIKVWGEDLQVYVYDSQSYQDMIGGKYDPYEYDLSFEIGQGQETSVSVAKHWTCDHPDVTSVQAQLKANGSVIDTVELNAKNNWAYTWSGLPEKNILNKTIEYTVKEVPVPGYTSIIEQQKSSTFEVPVWQKVGETENFVNGTKYLFVSDIGALGAGYNEIQKKGTLGLWNYDLSNPSNTPEHVIWQAYDDPGTDSNGRYSKFINVGYQGDANNRRVMGFYTFLSGSGINRTDFILTYRDNPNSNVPTKIYFDDDGGNKINHFYTVSGSTRKYFDYFFSGKSDANGWSGDGHLTTDYSKALQFTAYKLVNKSMPSADKNFLITNSKVTTSSPKTQVTVQKEWLGRHPEAIPKYLTVKLLQNGNAYDTVTLTQEMNWSYTWDNLPLRDSKGVGIEYTVEEAVPNNFKCYPVKTDDGTGVTITLKNVFQLASVAVVKRVKDSSRPLEGVEFQLYKVDENGAETIPGTDKKGTIVNPNLVTTEDGMKWLGNLNVGSTYYLVETKTLPGYNLLPGPIGFTPLVDENGQFRLEYTGEVPEDSGYYDYWYKTYKEYDGQAFNEFHLHVYNEPGYQLPETGGDGTMKHRLIGGGMLLLLPILYAIRRRYRGRRVIGG